MRADPRRAPAAEFHRRPHASAHLRGARVPRPCTAPLEIDDLLARMVGLQSTAREPGVGTLLGGILRMAGKALR